MICSTRTAALLRHPPCGSDSHPPRGSDTPWPPALRLWPACATTGRARTRTRPAALRLTSSACPCSRWQAVCRAAHTLRDGQHSTGLRRVGSRCALRRAPACTTPRVGRAAPPRIRASPLRRLTPAIRDAALRECSLARSLAGGRKRECFPVRCSSAAHCAPHSQHDIFHAQLRPKETVVSCGGKIDCLPSSAARAAGRGPSGQVPTAPAKAPSGGHAAVAATRQLHHAAARGQKKSPLPKLTSLCVPAASAARAQSGRISCTHPYPPLLVEWECFPVRCSSAAHCAPHSQHDIFHAQLRPKETGAAARLHTYRRTCRAPTTG